MCLHFVFGLWKWVMYIREALLSIHMGEKLILYKLKIGSLKVKASICSESYAHYLYLLQNKL